MKRLLTVVLLSAGLLCAQTAQFPTAVAGDNHLKVAANRAQSTLTGDINQTATTIAVANGAAFLTNSMVTIDNERISICLVSGNTLTVGYSSCPNVDGRGFDGSVAAYHNAVSTVSAYVSAWHHNAVREEIQAIETQLGVNLANVVPAGGNAGTATALAANGANCAAGNYPLGVDAAGAVEGCTVAGGGVAWGAITGTLADQTDLNSALGGKEPTITSGTTGQYWRGDKSWQTLDKTAVGLGSVENTALSTWAGSTNITTLGTVTTGSFPYANLSGAPSGPVLGAASLTTLGRIPHISPAGSLAESANLVWSRDSADLVGPQIVLQASGGTFAAPTIITTGKVLGSFRGAGYDGSNYLNMGGMDVVSEGTIAGTRVPTRVSFYTATNAAPSVLTESLRLTSGQMQALAGTEGVPAYSFLGSTNSGFAMPSAGDLRYSSAGTYIVQLKGGSAPTWQFKSTAALNWSSGVIGTTSDVGFLRNAAGILEVNNGASSASGKWAGLKLGSIQMQSLATPGTPTVTPTGPGTPAGTAWGYKIVAKLADGTTVTAAGAEGTTATGAATLGATNYNALSWSAVTGASYYDVYRTTAGGTPSSTGRISTSGTAVTFNDTGIAGSGSAPTVNGTGSLLWATDAGGDIGAAASGRPAKIYAQSGMDGGYFRSTSTGNFQWSSRSVMLSPSNGVIELTNAAVTDFDRLQFGGTTSSFPALKRSTTTLQVRLADDSGDANLTAGTVTAALTGNASTATALAADPADCSAGAFASGINASGTLSCGAPLGYVLQVFSGNTASITDPATLYAGMSPLTIATSAATRRVYIPKAGTVKTIYGTFIQTVGGTTETSTLSFRLNDTTDTAISSAIINDANTTTFSNTGLSIAVAAGDYFEFKWVTPTWATNPTNVSLAATVYIE